MRKETRIFERPIPLLFASLVAAGAGCSGDDGRGRGGGVSGSTGATAATDAATVTGGDSGTTAATQGGTTGTDGSGSSAGASTSATQGDTTAGDSTGVSTAGDTGTTGAAGSSGGAGCTPVSDDETVCDGIDDDCNGLVDDVDLGGDGFCDCLSIGILGNPGSNPSANFQQWLMDQGTTVVRFGTTPAYTLSLADLEQYDVLIIDNLPKVFSDAERAEFSAWLAGGGSFMSMAGYVNSTVDRDEQNSLVSASGLSYTGASVLLEPQTEWAPHPITNGLGVVRFLGGWVVEGVGDTVMHVLGDPSTRLGVAVDTGTYRAFVYGDEWVSFDSEWTNYPSVPVFWENVLKWLSPPGYCLSPQ